MWIQWSKHYEYFSVNETKSQTFIMKGLMFINPKSSKEKHNMK